MTHLLQTVYYYITTEFGYVERDLRLAAYSGVPVAFSLLYENFN